MGHDSGKARLSLNVTLDADLVRRASGLTADLSQMMETLLRSHVEAEEARRASDAAQIAQWIAASHAIVEQFGVPGDEYRLV